MTETTSVIDAARLIALGLRPRLVPARDETYRELIRRHRDDDEFAALVDAVATGLGLAVLEVSERAGLVAASTTDSVFAVRMTDYARRTAGEGKAHERVLHALAHLGIATLAFPRPADLADDTRPGRITVDGVEAFVREACRRLDERVAAAGATADPPADTPELEAVWRVYKRRSETGATGDTRKLHTSTRGIVSKAAAFLADQGLLVRINDDYGGTYRTTTRYQIQVREASGRMLEELLVLGITEVVDGTGTLHIQLPDQQLPVGAEA